MKVTNNTVYPAKFEFLKRLINVPRVLLGFQTRIIKFMALFFIGFIVSIQKNESEIAYIT